MAKKNFNLLYIKAIKLIINSIKLLKAIFRNQISNYPDFVNQFENKFTKYINTKYGVLFANGTTSLEAILFALNVRKNDEILVPSQTFFSTISPIINSCAKVKFVDIDYETLNISVKDLKSKISSKTKLVIIVHLYGLPCDMNEILKLKKKFNFLLVEDCSHAHGAKYDKKNVGSYGDLSFFSFQGNKAIAAGEGGIALTNNKFYYECLQSYGHFGRHSGNYTNKKLKDISFTGIGRKSRPHPLGMILADTDLKYLDRINKIYEENYIKLSSIIKESKIFITTLSSNRKMRGGYYRGFPLYIKKNKTSSISFKEFNKLISEFKKQNIEVSYFPNILSNYKQPLFVYSNYVDYIFNRQNKLKKFTNLKSKLINTDLTYNKIMFINLNQRLDTLNLRKISKIIKNFESKN